MAASTSYSQNPSSSTSPPTPWDVFLSFRGTDTRYTFTGHLYKALQRTGIRTFKDDPDLRSGEVISDSLIQAIQDSKAYIIVLSENYASSSWCLDELIEILSCYKRLKRLVVPVFYNIEPSVARHQLGSFKEAFETHQTRIDIKKVNKWRLALSEIADVSGYHISRDRSQADIIDEVVDRISLEINPKTLYVAKYPVGLDSRVESVTELIKSDQEGVIRIGIHGMGGVGKTTLAKALYNQNYQQFQGSCFLANVREVSGTENGLVGLQHQLIVDVLKCNNLNIGNKDQGIELIRARLCSTKVLLVVDDLDNLKPLEYLEGSFALGSLIVITTRNEDLLDRIKVKAKYKVNPMGKHESRQLFNQHAFREDNVSQIFTELSDEILESAGGLPLALQVFGSTLLDESEDGWRWFIDKLKRAPIDDVEENLMISFDALKSIDPNLQDIFLDIACFYIGWEKEEVAKILETCYTFVNRNVDILQKRCLITISDKDQFGILGMHDLLRDMGRKIARTNSPDEPGKHSRLWVSEDIDTVLKNREGTEAIQGIISGYPYYKYQYYDYLNKDGETFVAKSFKRMSKLKFLYLDNVNLTGSFKQTFKDLRWLCWKFFPLECFPSDFYAEKLVILEMPWSNMRITWEPPREFKKLKTLNMSGSRKLETTPNFIRLPCLETLNLEVCSSLEEVHVSIGCLASLVHLNLSNCGNLKSLPDSICSLRALEVLIVDGCTRLEALPTELGSIESLKTLNARRLTVSKLPVSIGHLITFEDLRWLRWVSFPLECLPSEFYAEKLVVLELPWSNMRTTWEPPREFKKLKTLNMSGSEELQKTPNFIRLPCLETLNLEDCSSLEEVHVSIGCLASLVHLNLSNCGNLKSLPDSICSLRALEVLIVDGCTRLEALPTELGSIESLKTLNASELSVSKLPYSIGRLSNLVNLYFGGNKNLESLPDSIWNLRSLEILDISDFEKLEELNLCNLKHLKKLDLSCCHSLTEIIGLEGVTSLEWLRLPRCRSTERLPNLCNLKHLKMLDLNSLKFLHMAGGNSSFLACTLTKRFFEILSRFGHKVEIFIGWKEFRYWICQDLGIQLKYGSRMSLDLQPNASHNFLAIILAFKGPHFEFEYSVKNITSGFIWRGTLCNFSDNGSSIVIVPSSILSIGDGDNRIELQSDQEIVCGIHLLYKTNNVEDERSNPLHSDLESNKMWLSLGSSSTTVNVREQRSNPAHGDLGSNKMWLSLGSSSTSTVNVREQRSNPVHSDFGSSTTVNVREQRRNPVHSDLESNRKGYYLGSSSTTVNVGEKRSNPLDNDLESNKNWLSLGNNSTTVRVEENRSYPSKRLKHLECGNWLSL